jgi:hypothetical protein
MGGHYYGKRPRSGNGSCGWHRRKIRTIDAQESDIRRRIASHELCRYLIATGWPDSEFTLLCQAFVGGDN